MGDPTRRKKQYEKPKKLWDKARIEAESKLREDFGLKNARELWRVQTILRRIRREARRLLSGKGAHTQERAERLLARVKKMFLQKANLTLDDLLSLGVKDVLERRLQSVVVKKRLAKTMHQARQFIAHGDVSVRGKRVSAPSYLVSFEEEAQVDWFKKPMGVFATTAAAEPAGEEKGIANQKEKETEKIMHEKGGEKHG